MGKRIDLAPADKGSHTVIRWMTAGATGTAFVISRLILIDRY